MRQFTDEQFTTLREGISAAKLLIDRLLPALAARHAFLPQSAKWIVKTAPEPIKEAFNVLIDAITAGDRVPPTDDTPGPEQKVEFDVKLIRNELENVCALVLPDLAYELQCALAELPGFAEHTRIKGTPCESEVKITTWAWEAGRRYGLMEAIAVCNGTFNAAHGFTTATLEATRDRRLDGDPLSDTDQPKQCLVN